MTNETLKQAALALMGRLDPYDYPDEQRALRAAIDAIDAIDAEQAKGREAVAEVVSVFYGGKPPAAATVTILCESAEYYDLPLREGTLLYTTPPAQPARECVALTEYDVFKSVEIMSVNGEYLGQPMPVLMKIVRAVEGASREKNAGQPVVKLDISKEWLAEKLEKCDDGNVSAGRPCDAPPGCNAHNCLECDDFAKPVVKEN